jgi:hypothetical protein
MFLHKYLIKKLMIKFKIFFNEYVQRVIQYRLCNV